MAKILEEGPIRRFLRKRANKSPELERERPLATPVTVVGFTLRNMEDVTAFKNVYGPLTLLYEDFSRRCSTTHHPLDCIPTHIMGDYMRKLMKAVDELRAQGAW